MKLRFLIALGVTAASFCPRSEAQTDRLTPGALISWGDQLIPCVQPGTSTSTGSVLNVNVNGSSTGQS